MKLSLPYPGTQRGITDVSLHLQQGSFTVITGSEGNNLTASLTGTLTFTIGRMLGLNPTDEDLQRAISLAVFDQDLATMPDGLNTVVGPRGMRLSGEQLQRAAATRMMIRQPDLLIFDDLSCALDIETEQKLWTRLFYLHSSPNPKSKI